MPRKIGTTLCSLAVFAFCLAAVAQEETKADPAAIQAVIEAAVDGEQRSDEHRARDRFRHPGETLDFFGLRPDMNVIEIWPGGAGWYTEIIAPIIKDEGQLTAVIFDPAMHNFYKKMNDEFAAKLEADPELYGGVKTVIFNPPIYDTLAEDGSADLVLTFRNVHNWMNRGYSTEAFEAFYRALKPGGVLGLVEHRGNGSEQDPSSPTGYVNQDYVIKLAEHAGFILVASSEINANPADDADHPFGVWTLPPRLAGPEDHDRGPFEAIGESDRMTLKFVKP